MKKLALLCLCVALVTLSAPAADWPQWQGPNRDNINPEKGLIANIPAGGPKKVWEFTECGYGYSSPAVVGEKLFIGGVQGDDEVVFCLNSQTGKSLWKAPAIIGPAVPPGAKGLDRGDGPRSTPAVDGDLVYVLGARGNLVCLDAGTGKEVWKKSLHDDLGGKMPNWGYSESPLVDGDLVLCSPGGSKGSLAALNKKTGEVVWRSKEVTDGAAYSSIIVANFPGVRHYAQMTTGGLVGVDAKTGKLLWKEKVAVNGVAIIPSPIYHDGYVYATSDYNSGCGLVKLEKSGEGIKSKIVYESKTMQNHHGGVVLLDGHLYGNSGNCNNRVNWICQEFLTGKEVGKGKFEETGSLTCADGKLFLYGQETGTLVLVDPSPMGYKELGRFKIPATSKLPRKGGKIWARPVVANGKLYLRDLDLLYCFDVAAK
jgi:outer membrane protein assembly factor BamB